MDSFFSRGKDKRRKKMKKEGEKGDLSIPH